jgi:arsenate reductase
MSGVTIWHNPNCSTSRNALALLRERGIEPEVVLYLKNPPDRDTLQATIRATGQPARALLRDKEALCAELGLNDPSATDEQLINAMLAHPVLINRPVVITPLGARLGRPLEKLLEVMTTP